MAHHPSSATPAIPSGIARPIIRHVGIHVRQLSGRSRASPTPMSAMITVASAMWAVARASRIGLTGSSPGTTRPTTTPKESTTIGAENARPSAMVGSRLTSSRPRPRTT